MNNPRQKIIAGIILLAGLVYNAVTAQAGLPQAQPAPEGRVMLPQDHKYQQVLRNYMATLTEEDFAHGVTNKMSVVETKMDNEALYRLFIMGMMQQPMVGFKRGIPSVNSPAWLFLLSAIEGPETGPTPEEAMKGFEPQSNATGLQPGPITTPTGIVRPPVWPEALVAFTEWDYPGNPFRHNRALKMRAFVTAAVRMIMLDNFLSNGTQNRSDWNAYKLVTFGRTYMGVKDLLPPEVRTAYLEGIRRLGDRIIAWGIRGEQPEMDMTGPIGLWYAANVLDDPEFSTQAENWARRLMSDPQYFHPAGYWVERKGGPDLGFSGMANFFAVWTALASEWPFALEAVEKAYRLRAHLSLPEPDGTVTGPSAFNSRLGTQAAADQWDWDGARDHAALMLTDEAAHAVRRPTHEELTNAPSRRIDIYTSHLHGPLRNPYNPFRSPARGNFGYILDADLRGSTWQWRLWDTYNFPTTLNPGYEFYRPDAYARLQRLEQKKPEMFDLPYTRDETFLRNFGNAFITTRQPSYAAILHTGPVGPQDPNDGLVQYGGPMGFGGGQLSAFWTPKTGSVILGRRSGMNPDRCYDKPAEWRQWPIHAVSGITGDGMVFTTARITEPKVTYKTGWLRSKRGTVEVSGLIPAHMLAEDKSLNGQPVYARRFSIEPDGVRVETRITLDGRDAIVELYETLPVYLRDTRNQPKATPTAIELQVNGQWQPADVAWVEQTTAVRLTRFEGAVEIIFETPQRVKLSESDWTDSYITRASCRNVMIDLLENGQPLSGATIRSVAYRIAPVK